MFENLFTNYNNNKKINILHFITLNNNQAESKYASELIMVATKNTLYIENKA